MCILFIYNGDNDVDSDYSLIIVANRDEFFERPSQSMGPWIEDSNVYGGRDLQPGSGCGTWMAINPMSKKLGLLLNLPGVKNENAKSRGKIVADFVKSDYNLNEFVTNIKTYVKECNDFIFITVEYGNSTPVVKSYSNATDVVDQWTETYLGFGNSLPKDPLKKTKMCILFIYNGDNDVDSDYSLIIVANRDEFFERPSQSMGPWIEDSNVYGGRDLQPGSGCGTWMAINPMSKKLGLLLNLPGVKNENAKSRGKIVADFVKSDYNLNEFVTNIKTYVKECNDFIFITVEYGNSTPVVKSYSNATDVVDQWTETYLGFGNSLPKDPLKKVEVGISYLKNIPPKHNKVSSKSQLIDELITFLKTTESHLPDAQLEARQPDIYKELSSIFVNIPKVKYGTRAHTIVLITKSGHVDLIEISMQSPINVEAPNWERKEFNFDI